MEHGHLGLLINSSRNNLINLLGLLFVHGLAILAQKLKIWEMMWAPARRLSKKEEVQLFGEGARHLEISRVRS